MGVLLEAARTFEDELIALRRDLHRHPELSFRETRTAATVAERIEAIGGFEVRREVGRTGVVADLRNGSGPLVALRADMDALPIEERNDVPYRSTVPGVMHACGHDTHVAMLIGAARLVAGAKTRGELAPGTVRLLFQPSEEAADEENKSGAARMIEDGAMDGVDAVFGLHIRSHMPTNRIYLKAGPLMAGADTFHVTVEGNGSHAARPHNGIDAVVLAAHVVLACQNAVARRISPLANGVLTIGRLNGGVAENVLADHVVLEGTVRYYDDEVRRILHEELHRAAGVADTLGGRGTVELSAGYPPVINDPVMTELARAAVEEALDPAVIAEPEPTMGAEDFALLLERAPGTFLWLGAALERPREHHHPEFDIDEGALVQGASALAACAMRALHETGAVER